jgi:hypothetical protein
MLELIYVEIIKIGGGKMKDTHETEPTKNPINSEGEQLYSPINHLQNIESGGFKSSRPQLGRMPKGIRFIGYFMIGFFVVAGILAIVLNFK